MVMVTESQAKSIQEIKSRALALVAKAEIDIALCDKRFILLAIKKKQINKFFTFLSAGWLFTTIINVLSYFWTPDISYLKLLVFSSNIIILLMFFSLLHFVYNFRCLKKNNLELEKLITISTDAQVIYRQWEKE